MPALHALKPEPRFVIAMPVAMQRPIDRIIDVVARTAGVSPHLVRRAHVKAHHLFNARSAVAVLSLEFCSQNNVSLRTVDNAMNMADGVTYYYRRTHAERCKLYPDYRTLYIKARIALMAGER